MRNRTTASGGEVVDHGRQSGEQRQSGGAARKRVQELAQRKQKEFDDMMRLLKERVEEIKANRGNLPEFVARGSSIVQLGHIELHPTAPAGHLRRSTN